MLLGVIIWRFNNATLVRDNLDITQMLLRTDLLYTEPTWENPLFLRKTSKRLRWFQLVSTRGRRLWFHERVSTSNDLVTRGAYTRIISNDSFDIRCEKRKTIKIRLNTNSIFWYKRLWRWCRRFVLLLVVAAPDISEVITTSIILNFASVAWPHPLHQVAWVHYPFVLNTACPRMQSCLLFQRILPWDVS